MPRVLLLISDADTSHIAAAALAGADFDVEAVSTRAAALDFVQSHSTDAVFVQSSALPDGIAVFAAQLRAAAGDNGLPICLMSSRPDLEKQARGRVSVSTQSGIAAWPPGHRAQHDAGRGR